MSNDFKDKVDRALSFYKAGLTQTQVQQKDTLQCLANELVSIGYGHALGKENHDVILEVHKANHSLCTGLMGVLPFVPEESRNELSELIRSMGSSSQDITPYTIPLFTDNIRNCRRFADDVMKPVDIIANKLSVALPSDKGMLTTFPTGRETASGNFEYHVAICTVDQEIIREVRDSVYKLPKNETLLMPMRMIEKESDMVFYNPNPFDAFGYVSGWYFDELTRMVYADIVITDKGMMAEIAGDPNGLTAITVKPRFTRDGNYITRAILLEVMSYGETIPSLLTRLEDDMEQARVDAKRNTPDDAPPIVLLSEKEASAYYGYGKLEISEGVNPQHRLYAAPHFINGEIVAKVVQVLTPKGDLHGQIRFDTNPVTRKLTIDGLLAMVQFAITDNPDISDSVGDEAKLLIKELSDMT